MHLKTYTCVRMLLATIFIGAVSGPIIASARESQEDKLVLIRELNDALKCKKHFGFATVEGKVFRCGMMGSEIPDSGENFNLHLLVQNPKSLFVFGLSEMGSEELLSSQIEPGVMRVEARYTDPIFGPIPVDKSLSLQFSEDGSRLESATFYDSRKEGGIWVPEITCEFVGPRCD